MTFEVVAGNRSVSCLLTDGALHTRPRTDILTLTGSSKAEELANEYGSMNFASLRRT